MLSVLPFLLVIPISIVTRQVIPGLLVGLVAGAYLIHPTFLGGIDETLTYLFRELAIPGNLHLIVFLYLFGSFVGLIRVTGGVAGFAAWLTPRIRTSRAAHAVTWLSALATFMAPDFRIITVAPVMRAVAQSRDMDEAEFSYAIQVTSTPLISVIPVATVFVGYMVGLVTLSLRHAGMAQSGFSFFLSTLPFNFFAWAILGIGLLRSFVRRSQPVMDGSAKPRVRISRTSVLSAEVGELGGVSSEPLQGAARAIARGNPTRDVDDQIPDGIAFLSARVAPVVLHLSVPILLLLVSTFFFTWWSGHTGASSVWSALASADAAKAMLESILITLIIVTMWYAIRNIPLSRLMYGIIAGGNEMVPVVLLLVLVWAISGVSNDLGFSQFVSHTAGTLIPRMWVAPALFLVGSVLSYFIGSSFGTWGIMMPLGFSLAHSTGTSLALVAGAVFASGTLGGFASPLSDNTAAMASVTHVPVMTFARSLLGSTIWAAAISTVGYAVAGFLL